MHRLLLNTYGVAALACLLVGPAAAQSVMPGLPGVSDIVGMISGSPPVPVNMYTPVMMQGQATPSTSSANYMGMNNLWQSTVALKKFPSPISGVASDLSAYFATTFTLGTYTVTLTDVTSGASIGGLTNCPIGNISSVNHTYCNDPFATESLSIAEGDLLVVEALPTGPPTSQSTNTAVSFLLRTTDGTSAIFSGNDNANVSSTLQNWQAFGGGVVSGVTEVNVSSIIPGPTPHATVGSIDHLHAYATSTMGANKGYVVLLYQNGVPTTQGGGSACLTAAATGVQATILAACTCVIISTSPSNECTNKASGDAPVSIAALDTISTSTYPFGSPATSAEINASFRYTPSVLGNALVFGNAATIPTVITSTYAPISGGTYVSASSETKSLTIAPIGMTVKDFVSAIDTAPPSGDTRTQTLRANGAISSGPTCSIGSSAAITVGGAANVPACYDTTHTYSISSAATLSPLDILTSQNAGANSVAAYLKNSAVVTVP